MFLVAMEVIIDVPFVFYGFLIADSDAILK
ncbi:hypothetical protein AAEX37_00697 [Oligella sp. MSHR50489EDL]